MALGKARLQEHCGGVTDFGSWMVLGKGEKLPHVPRGKGRKARLLSGLRNLCGRRTCPCPGGESKEPCRKCICQVLREMSIVSLLCGWRCCQTIGTHHPQGPICSEHGTDAFLELFWSSVLQKNLEATRDF